MRGGGRGGTSENVSGKISLWKNKSRESVAHQKINRSWAMFYSCSNEQLSSHLPINFRKNGLKAGRDHFGLPAGSTEKTYPYMLLRD